MEAGAREVTYETHDLDDRVGARTPCHACGGADTSERRGRVRRPATARGRCGRRRPSVRVLSPRGRRRAAPLLLPLPAAAALRTTGARPALPPPPPAAPVRRRPRRAAETTGPPSSGGAERA